MKKMTKLLCLILALVLATAAFASCTGKKGNETESKTAATDPIDDVTTAPADEPKGPDAVEVDLDELLDENEEGIDAYVLNSRKVYKEALGEFYTAYLQAKGQSNVSYRYALMAIAEAKLLESGVMVPTTTRGGNYAISRVAPYTASSTLWGNDSDRFHNVVIATEPIKAAERDEMKAKWGELKGTGTYEQWAKDYLKGKGYTLKTDYKMGYSEDPDNWDVLASSLAIDAEALVNTFDGLLEYDSENIQKPALAESYTVSEDGLTYTFKIRQGVKWVNSQGVVQADVKADDFVAGMQHMMDAEGGLEYLVDGIIKNAAEYNAGEITDFSQVGVKAVDDSTLVYTLEAPCSYFMTMLAYSIFAPMSRAYFLSQGGVFGADFKTVKSTVDYKYGKGPDSIVYCGPYLVQNATAKSTISFVQNDKYWNKDKVGVTSITWLFNDGTDTMKAYNDMVAGTIDGAGLNASALEQSKKDGKFDTLAYVSATDATSYMAFFNIDRSMFESTDKKLVSPMTDGQREASKTAMANQHFRMALAMAFDRGSYNSQSVGEELKLVSLRNSYTPGTFVSLEEEVTVEIGGQKKTYPAGTLYGQIMQDQIDADGFKVKVWDPDTLSGDSFDGWYNAANAKAELNKAISELSALNISKDNPIYIDMPYFEGNEVSTKRANSLKKSIEDSLEGKVIVNIIGTDQDSYYDACYLFDTGDTANYTINTLSGWGPDYGDPQTYLDTFLPEYGGYMVKSLGIY